VVNTDEEIGSTSSERLIALLARGAVRAFVLEGGEGGEGRLKIARKGSGRFVVTVRGRASHAGSSFDHGVSAILELSHLVQQLFALNDPRRGVTVNVGTVDGGLRPNVVAPEATATVDVRVPTRAAARGLDRSIRSLHPVVAGSAVHVEGEIGPPMEPTPRNRRLLSTALRVGRELGLELEDAGLVGGASDANTTSLYTATLDGLGPAGGSDHAPDEHMSIESTVERAAPHAREERVALVGRHRRDERRRRDAVAEVGGREPLLEREPPLLGRAEERARRERRPPRSLPLRDDGAAQRGEELLHPALHRVAEVAHVPEE